MKRNFLTSSARFGGLIGIAAGALLLAGIQHTDAVSVLKSPVGTLWDCTMSGHGQIGIAYLDFEDDGSFSGFRLLSSSRLLNGFSSTNTVGRGGGTIGRGGSGSTNTTTTTSSGSITNLIGADYINGIWTYDERGRIVGSFAEIIAGEPPTTNDVSFLGTVVPGKRLTLVSSTASGKVTYRGLPARTNLTDLTGDWTGTRTINKRSFFETFTLGPGELPNVYMSEKGSGATYDLDAVAAISVHKKVGFAFYQIVGTNAPTLSAVIGPLKRLRSGILISNGRGLTLDSDSGDIMNYHAVRLSAPPPPPAP